MKATTIRKGNIIRHNGTLYRVLVMDHGVPAGAKYTLGGWQTRVGPHLEIDGTSALLIEGVTGKAAVDAAVEGIR